MQTLPRASEEGGPGLDVLDGLLAREHPARVYFFLVRRGTDAAGHAIRARGFEGARRTAGNMSARLIEYRRTGSRD